MTLIDPFAPDYDPATAPKERTITMCDDCKDILYGKAMTELLRKLEGRTILCLIIHGSKLYGLDHADSDTDLKGVFIPSERDILLGNIPDVIKYTSGNDDSKNSKDDIDIEMWSIHHFFKVAMQGDTGAISMLNAPFEKICSQRPMWKHIVENANIFYAKNMEGLIGYVRTQTSRYSIKGSRLTAVNDAKHFLDMLHPNTQLKDVWDNIPEDEHAIKMEHNNQIFWEVCGRKIQNTCNAEYALGVINAVIRSYGERARQASEDGGLDWKAISHAFRVASELSDLFQFGIIRYPLDDYKFIKQIKMGELDFETEVLPSLNSLMDRVHKMSVQSDFPDEVDQGRVNDFLFELLKNNNQ